MTCQTSDTHASIETFDRGAAAAPDAARLMAGVLGWTDRHAHREVAVYLDRVRAERESQEKTDDASADQARVAAQEITPPREMRLRPARE